jgi:hypothetical protein
MRSLAIFVTTCLFGSPALAQCFHNPSDKTETIRIDDLGTITWTHGEKAVDFETGSGGTGVEYRVAYDPDGNGFRYEYVGDDLVFGGVKYVKGCD